MYFQFVLILIPMVHYFFSNKRDCKHFSIKDFFKDLGFLSFNTKNLLNTIFLYSLLIISFFLISVFYTTFFYSGTDPVELYVLESFESLGFLFFVYLFFGVFAEELFFRAYLIKHLGVYISTFIFAILHYTYGTYIQVIGAFFLGLILAYFYKKSNNFYEVFIAHFLYNLTIVLLVIL